MFCGVESHEVSGKPIQLMVIKSDKCLILKFALFSEQIVFMSENPRSASAEFIAMVLGNNIFCFSDRYRKFIAIIS